MGNKCIFGGGSIIIGIMKSLVTIGYYINDSHFGTTKLLIFHISFPMILTIFNSW